jgi:hypothetical protein
LLIFSIWMRLSLHGLDRIGDLKNTVRGLARRLRRLTACAKRAARAALATNRPYVRFGYT